jgi:hypothetical protein
VPHELPEHISGSVKKMSKSDIRPKRPNSDHRFTSLVPIVRDFQCLFRKLLNVVIYALWVAGN